MPFEQDPKNPDQPEGGQQPSGGQPAGGQPAPAPAAPAPDDHTKVFLVAGERAFKDADSVVKHVEHAQSHISTLEAERQADRDKLAEQEQELERLRKVEEGLNGRQAGNADQTDQLSIDEIATRAAKLAVGNIEQSNTEAVQQANQAKADEMAIAAYGKDEYVAKVQELAGQMGMTLKAVDELCKDSPDAFKRLFIPADPGQPHVPTSGSVNVPAGQQQQQQNVPAKNVVKMKERERITHVTSKMQEAGITYNN